MKAHINGAALNIDVEGLKHGDQIKHVGARCEQCAADLDCEAFLFARDGRCDLQCATCGTCYAIESD